MRSLGSTFAAAFIFALGLGISGMTQPQKIIGFLDFFGDWDPSMLFVITGAIAAYAVVYRLALRRPRPVLAKTFAVPSRRTIDKPLIAGSALFGVGWGLSGLCPGPAIVASVSGSVHVVAFVVAVIVGMLLYHAYSAWNERRTSSRSSASDPNAAIEQPPARLVAH